MLYIPRNRQISLKVPRISAKYTIADTLRLVGTIDLTPIAITVEVLSVSARYFTISVTFPELQQGEYRYELMNGREVVSSGLAIVENRGEFSNDFNIAFKRDRDKTYRQYEQAEEYYQYEE